MKDDRVAWRRRKNIDPGNLRCYFGTHSINVALNRTDRHNHIVRAATKIRWHLHLNLAASCTQYFYGSVADQDFDIFGMLGKVSALHRHFVTRSEGIRSDSSYDNLLSRELPNQSCS